VTQQLVSSQKAVMEKRIFKRFLTKSQKQERITTSGPDDYSLEELIHEKSVKLKSMYFEIIGINYDNSPSFLNIHKKKYMKNGVEKTMIQIVDVT
jgi:hypothetical protein